MPDATSVFKYDVIRALLSAKRPDLANVMSRSFDTEQIEQDEATAIETPRKYRNRTGRCPPGHKSNEKETCIDMKERRKKRRWEQQQKAKERRLAER